MDSRHKIADLDEVLNRVRTVAMQAAEPGHGRDAFSTTVNQPTQVDSSSEPAPASIDYFQSFHDGDFVRQAYRGILHREADAGGFGNYLDHLRSGRMNKLEILAALRHSEEGMRVGQEVLGLERGYKVHRLFQTPIVGRLLKSFEVAWRLPSILRNIEKFEGYVNGRLADLKGDGTTMAGLRRSIDEIQVQLAKLFYGKADLEGLTRLVDQIRTELQQKAERRDAGGLQEVAEALAAGKADVETLAGLQDELVALSRAKADAVRVVALPEEVNSLGLGKAERSLANELSAVLGSLAKRVKALGASEADQATLTAVAEELSHAGAQLKTLATTKATSSAPRI